MKYVIRDKKKKDLLSSTILLSNTYSSVREHQLAKNFQYNQIKELETDIKIGLWWTDGNGEIV
ncbi:unnamed protein product, partial [Rotaria sp. Silwood2]